MNIALWTVASILAFAFLAAGLMKLARSKQQLVDAGMPWVADASPAFVKSIGVLEILAAIGLIVPALTGIAPVFVPLAAVGLVLVMLGAAVLHARRKEIPNIVIALVILALAVFVAWGRFGPTRSLPRRPSCLVPAAGASCGYGGSSTTWPRPACRARAEGHPDRGSTSVHPRPVPVPARPRCGVGAVRLPSVRLPIPRYSVGMTQITHNGANMDRSR